MTFVHSLLSWIPLVSFKSDQEKDESLSLDSIQGFEVEAPPSPPNPPQHVIEELQDAAKLEDAGWNVRTPQSGEVHTYQQKLKGWQLRHAIDQLDAAVRSAHRVKKYVNERIVENNDLRKHYGDFGFKVLVGTFIIYALTLIIGLVWSGTSWSLWVAFGGVLFAILGIAYSAYNFVARPSRMYLRDVHPVHFDEDVPDSVSEKIQAIWQVAPDADITMYKVEDSNMRFAAASYGNSRELCFADWSNSENG